MGLGLKHIIHSRPRLERRSHTGPPLLLRKSTMLPISRHNPLKFSNINLCFYFQGEMLIWSVRIPFLVEPETKKINTFEGSKLTRKMGMEADDELMAAGSDSAERRSRAPRLFIKEMVMRNFKSYAGEQRVGPFHKVSGRLTSSSSLLRKWDFSSIF